MIIGAQKTFKFFFQRRKIKGTSCFLGGIGLVLLGWPVIGMVRLRQRQPCTQLAPPSL